MNKIAFTDGTKICILDENGNKTERESGFILKYKENARHIVAANEWKNTGMNARLRGDYNFENFDEGENAPAYLNSVVFTNQKDTVAYSFTVGQSSGIYYKDFSREKEDEIHLIHSNSQEFLSLAFDKKEGAMSASIRKNGEAEQSIVLFTPDGDYNSITGGDSRDENPYFSPVDGKILFDSAGVGRDERGNFVTYGNSALYGLEPLGLDMEILKEDKGVSYIKPKRDKQGNLYAVKRPVKEKSGGNPFLEIALIPVRLIEAIVGFVQFFVVAFSGKSLVSGKGSGNNPTKERSKKEREIFIEGNLVRVDKELKRNKRFKDKDYGFIPRSWQLVKLDKSGSETVLKSGVADYALGDEGVYCTDGRHIYIISASGTKKIADTDFCLHLDVERAP